MTSCATAPTASILPGALSGVRVSVAVVDDAKPVPGGALAVKRVNTACDGVVTYQARAASDTTPTICAPIAPPCDLSVSYAAIEPNVTTNRLCVPLSPPCDGKYRYQAREEGGNDDAESKKKKRRHTLLFFFPLSPPLKTHPHEIQTLSPPFTQSKAPTIDSDRECSELSPPCTGTTTYQSVDPSPLLDRQCSPIAPRCVVNVTFESVSPSPLQNRVCQPVQPECTGTTTWQNRAPTEFLDRLCVAVSPPCDGVSYYTTADATEFSDRVCGAVTICDGTTNYQVQRAGGGGGTQKVRGVRGVGTREGVCVCKRGETREVCVWGRL